MKVLHGIPASPGIAIGSAQTIHPVPSVDVTAKRSVDEAVEMARLAQAIQQAIARLDTLRMAAGGSTADILEAQREMLDDPELKEGADALIASGFTAEAAITRVADSYAEQLASLPDPYLAARAEDVREAGRRIVLNPAYLQAVVTETGSATGHLAIVAQGQGIPAVVGVTGALAQIDEGTTLIVDGDRGTVTVAPDEVSRSEAETRLATAQRDQRELEVYRDRPGMTADGVRVEVFANIGSLAEAHKAVEMGAEGVGLFRTEFITAHGIPSEEEQYAIYKEVAATLQRPLIVRTFDIGGDKPVPGLDIPAEANPFLGWRGIRLALDRPEEVFLPQIRAFLRVAASYDLRIMLPMVTVPQEVEDTRALIDMALQDLEREGKLARRVPLGIMVETPAAAVTLDQFRGLIDFASIGTNDLIQYTYAVDRTNVRVRERAKPLGTAILRLIEQVCRAGVPVAVCGQLAGDADAVPLLVGLGVRELSVAPARVPAVKRVLSSITLAEMQARAQQRLAV